MISAEIRELIDVYAWVADRTGLDQAGLLVARLGDEQLVEVVADWLERVEAVQTPVQTSAAADRPFAGTF